MPGHGPTKGMSEVSGEGSNMLFVGELAGTAEGDAGVGAGSGSAVVIHSEPWGVSGCGGSHMLHPGSQQL